MSSASFITVLSPCQKNAVPADLKVLVEESRGNGLTVIYDDGETHPCGPMLRVGPSIHATCNDTIIRMQLLYIHFHIFNI